MMNDYRAVATTANGDGKAPTEKSITELVRETHERQLEALENLKAIMSVLYNEPPLDEPVTGKEDCLMEAIRQGLDLSEAIAVYTRLVRARL